MIDARLLGTWQSDREMTFRHFKPKAGITPQVHRKFRAMFGKMVIRWSRTKYYTEIGGHTDSQPYYVVAKDANSVVIRHADALKGDDSLTQIHFEGDRYWFALNGGHLIEWFRKIP